MDIFALLHGRSRVVHSDDVPVETEKPTIKESVARDMGPPSPRTKTEQEFFNDSTEERALLSALHPRTDNWFGGL